MSILFYGKNFTLYIFEILCFYIIFSYGYTIFSYVITINNFDFTHIYFVTLPGGKTMTYFFTEIKGYENFTEKLFTLRFYTFYNKMGDWIKWMRILSNKKNLNFLF